MEQLDFTYKRLDDHCIKDVQYLFLKVFNKKKSATYIKNKYNTTYLGIKNICFIAYHNSMPVAFYGAIPQKFATHSSSILVAHACDSFTLPEYQKKGLHYNLALKSYELMKSEGIQFVYAYHSENTYFSTKKLNWLEHKKMERFHLKISTIPLAKIVKKTHLHSFYKKICDLSFNRFLSPNKYLLSTNTYKQIYNEDYIRYKNGFNTHYLIELNKCIFWIKVDAVLHVGFFSSNSEEEFKKAIKKLKKIASLLGINEILFQVLADSKEHHLLSKITEAKPSWLIGYLPFESINIDNFEFNYADLDTF